MTPRRVVAGRYRLEERIGSGAMGVVWRGTDERLGRVVAVKQVFLNQGLDEAEADEVRQRTLREGRIAARLQHPHAISVFDASIEGDEPWLVMEYLPSRSLAAMLAEQGPLDPRLVARIGRQVADALDAAHQAGIVHRDVKPGNVLIGSDGTVKITDFGISRATGDLTLTRTGMLAGTPAYLAPEVARGEDSTFASDVFSLGATLYASVEGIPPFGSDDNALALLHAVAAGAVHPPVQAGPLTALLMRLLRSDPSERPTPAEARRELGRIAHSAGSASTATWSRSDVEEARIPDSRRSTESDPVASGRGRGSTPPPTWRGTPTFDEGTPEPGPTLGDADHVPPPPPAARSNGSAPRPAVAAPKAPARRRRPTTVVVVVVLVVAVVAGVLLAIALTSNSGGTEGASLGGASSSTGQAGPTDQRTQMVAAVRDYYSIVTANPGAGWARLGPTMQDTTDGFANYQNFWSTIASVQVADATAVDDDTVRATLVFSPRSGSAIREVHELGMSRGTGGAWLINSDRRL
ncbi:serine/threonine-protein kinase [Actinomycetospora termitidis]|uniref:non-specific serine/threonine protein kinase n=1 Tax=Actinomycetospora termitidis TaxID=3053470 RepID=A0ABT7M4E0_9PSEU|nr:serine/threonine-protein kinase [Actinomycetospora sp. Odt1-22]MDL5155524.1 protein kinase [Actinomycetospora sp. Odt1-22]